MSPPGGSTATEQAPSCLNKNEPPQWGTEDILIAAYRLRAHGCTEKAAVLALSHFMQQGVKRIGRRIRRMNDEQLVRHLRQFESEAGRESARRPRGDLLTIRSDPRWPWRVSTS